MSCYHPMPAWKCGDGRVILGGESLKRNDVLYRLDLPCRQCIGCRMRTARDWSLRCMHEAQMWTENCFVTLTYDDEHLPADGSLKYRDYQLFMKKLRNAGYKPRFFMSGEYGGLNLRPHYHACLFNLNFVDRVPSGRSGSGELYYNSPILLDLWGHGRVSVQDLTKANAEYTARYVIEKVNGDRADEHYGGRIPEFCESSRKPGIGAAWFEKYGWTDAYRHDFIVSEGAKFAAPRFYDKMARRVHAERMEQVEFERSVKAKQAFADNTDERLAVREEVHKARVRNQKREL